MMSTRPQPAAAAATGAAHTADLVVPGAGVLPGVPLAGLPVAVAPPMTGGAFHLASTKGMAGAGAAMLVAPHSVGSPALGAHAAEARSARADREKAVLASKVVSSAKAAAATGVKTEPKSIPSFPWEFDGPTIELSGCTAQVAGASLLPAGLAGLPHAYQTESQLACSPPHPPSRLPLPSPPCAASAGEAMLKALSVARVDFSFDIAKYKAKCHAYERDGFCFFIARLYSRGGGAGFVAELQLRDGSRSIFGLKHKAVLRALVDGAAQSGGVFVLPLGSDAMRLARRLGFAPPQDEEERAAIAAAAAQAELLPPLGGAPPELAISALPSPPAALQGAGSAFASAPAPHTASSPLAVDEAVGAVVALMRGHFDDVATAGAEAALGIAESASARATLAARLTAPGVAPSVAFAALIDALVVRAGGKNNDSARCRTLSAFAFEGLAADAVLSRALVKHAAGILEAVSFDPRGAPQLFALRRSAVQAVRAIAAHSHAHAAAVTAVCGAQLGALGKAPYTEVDPAFDAAVRAASAALKGQ